MTNEQVNWILHHYQSYLQDNGANINQHLHSEKINEDDWKDHLLYMIDVMFKMLADNRMDKLFRWLGFVQGVFWSKGVFTIDEMRYHNTYIPT